MVEGWEQRRRAAAGLGAIADLAEFGLISVEDSGRNALLRVHHDAARPVDATLLSVFERLSDGISLRAAVRATSRFTLEETTEELCRQGIIAKQRANFLGLFPARYAIVDPTQDVRLRQRLAVVLGGGRPTRPEAAILAILAGIGLTRVLAENTGLSSSAMDRRIQALSEPSVLLRALTQPGLRMAALVLPPPPM